jgi:hypothetical protein
MRAGGVAGGAHPQITVRRLGRPSGNCGDGYGARNRRCREHEDPVAVSGLRGGHQRDALCLSTADGRSPHSREQKGDASASAEGEWLASGPPMSGLLRAVEGTEPRPAREGAIPGPKLAFTAHLS